MGLFIDFFFRPFSSRESDMVSEGCVCSAGPIGWDMAPVGFIRISG